MYLSLSNNNFKRFLLWIVILSTPILTFLFIQFSNTYSIDERIAIAQTHLNNWDLIKAEKILSPAVPQNKSNLTFNLIYLEVLLKEGKINKAKNHFYEIKNYKNIDNPLFLSYLAEIYFFNGIPDSAAIYARKTLHFSKLANNKKLESKANNILGLIKFYLAQYDSAYLYQTQALIIAKEIRSRNEEANALRQLGVLRWYKGDLDSADVLYQNALKLYKKVNNKIGTAITLSDIGLLYFDKKEWYKQYPYYLKAYKIQKEINNQTGLADTYYFLSHVPLFNRTMINYRYQLITKSYKLSGKIGYKWGRIVAYNSLIAFVKNNFSNFIDINRFINPLDDNTGEGELIKYFFNIFYAEKNKNIDEEIYYAKKSLKLSSKLNYDVYKYWAFLSLGRAYLELGKLNDAQKNLLEAKRYTKNKNGTKYYPINVDILLAVVLKEQHKINLAIQLLKQKAAEYDSIYIKNINKSRSIFSYEKAVESVYWQRNRIYSLLMDYLFEINDIKSFFYYSELRKSLPFWGNYGNETDNSGLSFSFLLNKFNNLDSDAGDKKELFNLIDLLEHEINLSSKENINLKRINFNFDKNVIGSIKNLQKLLNAKDVLIKYVFGDKNLYTIAVNKDDAKMFKINTTSQKITSLVKYYLKTIYRGKDNPKDDLWVKPSKKIYELLVQPIVKAGLIKKDFHIIFSPEHSLYRLPFESLVSGDDSTQYNFLVKDYVIGYVTSASNLRDEEKQLNLNSFLGIAPSIKGLQYNRTEVETIPKALFKTKKVLINSDATKNNFLKYGAEYDVIHIASHTNIDVQNPLNSSIEFADKPLKIYEIFNTKIRPKLLILSACSTGEGVGLVKDIPTDIDLINFSQIWKEAGVKYVISTKWLLEDKSAYLIFKNFYDLLSKEKGRIQVDKILSYAQRKYITEAKSKVYKIHPFYWAPFYTSL